MNKRLHILLTFVGIATLLAVVGCVEDKTPAIEGFEADTTTIEAEASGGRHNITIRSEREWSAVVDVPWVMVSPANGRGEIRCEVRIDSTLINDARSTEIGFRSGGEIMQRVAIHQAGYARAITPAEKSIAIAASATRAERNFNVELSTNVEFEVDVEYNTDDEWLTVGDYNLSLDRGARPRATNFNVNWRMNTDTKQRTATMHLRSLDGEELSQVVVTQAAAPVIEDNRQGDSLAVVTIYEKLECWSDGVISTTEPMQHWECLRLWDADDETLPSPEAIGRVRDLDLSYFFTEEGIPYEIKYLKYLETLSLFGNVNTMLKSIDMGEEVCQLEYLKALRVAAFGLVSLPKNFAALGDTLEVLDLNSNNFNAIPAVLTEQNFPVLKSLNLTANRRTSLGDLRNAANSENGIGLHHNSETDDALRTLLLWEGLEELALSYNYLEGSIPDFKVGENSVRAYTREDAVERGDSINWAIDNNLPRILPNARSLRLNLNFHTGRLPEWLLYHPRLMEWGAESFIYPQQESAVDSHGRATGFDNAPTSREYYFEAYPLMRGRYEFKDEITEE